MSPCRSFTSHWPEYLIEAFGLGTFMMSACAFVSLIEFQGSPFRQTLTDPLLRRALTGAAMGLTAIAIIYSPWGKRSGSHLNPAFTFTFLMLGRIAPWDALFYIVFQFAGGAAGVAAARLALGDAVIGTAPVDFVVTRQGEYGTAAAFAGELIISFVLMTMILILTNRPRLNRYTGLFAGCMIAVFIMIEEPISGMSMNPARSLSSAIPAREWTALWIYFTAPLSGMLIAAAFFCIIKGGESILCCKLHHDNGQRCIFRCRYPVCD
ncbi:MAG: MIP/aquaporin family protein [Gammaproteobacteria bacterium]